MRLTTRLYESTLQTSRALPAHSAPHQSGQTVAQPELSLKTLGHTFPFRPPATRHLRLGRASSSGRESSSGGLLVLQFAAANRFQRGRPLTRRAPGRKVVVHARLGRRPEPHIRLGSANAIRYRHRRERLRRQSRARPATRRSQPRFGGEDHARPRKKREGRRDV